MNNDESANVLSTLESLGRLEGAMARYYLACSESWGESSSLWMHLALEEEKHEKIIGDLAVIVQRHPDGFQAGLKIEPTAVETYILGIEEKANDVMKGKVPLKEALSFALSMEESILEGRFFEFIDSKNRHYLSFKEVMSAELERHRRCIIEEMEKIQAKADV